LNYDPDTLTGWGNRPFQWEFSTAVQRELRQGLSVDVGFFRRWYGNFGVADNLNVTADDYDKFSVVAPIDSRLPGGGGYTINGFVNLDPTKVSVGQNNQFRLASNYGKWTQQWNGFDFNVNSRNARGLTINAGLSTGVQSQNSCEVTAKVPEAGVPTAVYPAATTLINTPFCDQQDPWLTSAKVTTTYLVPKIGVQVSALFFSNPGPSLQAQKVYLNNDVKGSLGRDLSANAPNVTLNLIAPNAYVGDRRNQLDLRFTKRFTVNRTRIGANFELYNATNSNAVLTEGTTYVSSAVNGWRVPTTILTPRFIKLSMQLDF
jgi:hypothetical protein